MTRPLGVASCTRLDLMGLYGAAFADGAPQIDLRAPADIEDPEKVSFLVTFKPDPALFDTYPNLRAIFSVAAGTDAIMACPTRPPHLPVIRVEDPDQARQMAGFAVFHTFWHHRDMGRYLAQQARGEWRREVGGRTPATCPVGVMGFGHMGREITRALHDLGYPVATLTRSAPARPIEGVTHMLDHDRAAFLARTRILINVLPLTEATAGLLNADLFAALPEGAALIHLGRGAQLVEKDLLAALDSGRISGASLDVFATEPLPADSALWQTPGLFLTPHIASQPEPDAITASVLKGLTGLGML